MYKHVSKAPQCNLGILDLRTNKNLHRLVTPYVGYTARHLHQRIAEHKNSAIGRHFLEAHENWLQSRANLMAKIA